MLVTQLPTAPFVLAIDGFSSCLWGQCILMKMNVIEFGIDVCGLVLLGVMRERLLHVRSVSCLRTCCSAISFVNLFYVFDWSCTLRMMPSYYYEATNSDR